MKKIIPFFLLSYIVTSCGPSVEEEIKKYDEIAKKEGENRLNELNNLANNYLKDSLEILSKSRNNILELAPIFNALSNTTAKTEKKELILDASVKNKNTLYYHHSIFDTLHVSNIINFDYQNLNSMSYFTQKREYPFNPDDDISYSKENFNVFKQNCNKIANAKYALIQSDIEVKTPQLQDSVFSEGYYKGHAALIEINTKTVIDNFIFEAKSSKEVQNNQYYINGKASSESNITNEQALINDYFENIYLALDKEINERYTVKGALPKLTVSN